MDGIRLQLNETIDEMHAQAINVLSFWEGEAALSFANRLKEAESLHAPSVKKLQDFIL